VYFTLPLRDVDHVCIFGVCAGWHDHRRRRGRYAVLAVCRGTGAWHACGADCDLRIPVCGEMMCAVTRAVSGRRWTRTR
jgi:hypothetical protein